MTPDNTTNLPVTEDADTQAIQVSVEIFGGKATTSSMDIARHFGKQHKDVLKAVRDLLPELPSDHQRNFAPTVIERPNPSGGEPIKSPAYRITRDGFTLLAMGFTGKRALQFKLAYIDAFNRMERALIEQPEILSHRHLLQFALKTLELMRDRSSQHPPRPSTEQVVQNYLNLESLDQATPEQMAQAITFLQGQIIGEGAAAKYLPGVAGSSIAKDLLYGLLRSSHDAELLFNSLYDSGVEKLASDVFKNHMANKLAETSSQARDLLGYVASHAVRSPFTTRTH